jgi:hypothetical protein
VARHILRYLKGTKDLSITYYGDGHDEISPHLSLSNDNDAPGFSDASLANCLQDTRKFQTGYIFFINNGAVSWGSKRQTIVATSTMESEYIALSETAKEALFLSQLLAQINNSPYRTKHIDIKYHQVRDSVDQGFLNIDFVPSAMQCADILTKALSPVQHLRALRQLNVSRMPQL